MHQPPPIPEPEQQKRQRWRSDCARRRPVLDIGQILRWADAVPCDARATYPNTQDRTHRVGTVDENWRAMEGALSKGRRGLRGGSSLARLLAEHRGHRNIQAASAVHGGTDSTMGRCVPRSHRTLANVEFGTDRRSCRGNLVERGCGITERVTRVSGRFVAGAIAGQTTRAAQSKSASSLHDRTDSKGPYKN